MLHILALLLLAFLLGPDDAPAQDRSPGAPGTATPRPYDVPAPRPIPPRQPSGNPPLLPALPPTKSAGEPPDKSLPLIERQQQRSRRPLSSPPSRRDGPPERSNRRSQ